MAIRRLDVVMAYIDVEWESDDVASRMALPHGDVRAVNCAFFAGDDASAEHYMSILLERTTDNEPGRKAVRYGVDFIARELAYPYLEPGVELLIMTGPTVLGRAKVIEVLKDARFVRENPRPAPRR